MGRRVLYASIMVSGRGISKGKLSEMSMAEMTQAVRSTTPTLPRSLSRQEPLQYLSSPSAPFLPILSTAMVVTGRTSRSTDFPTCQRGRPFRDPQSWPT